MNRDIWKTRMTTQEIEELPCPNCNSTKLNIESEASYTYEQREPKSRKRLITKGAKFLVAGILKCNKCFWRITFNGFSEEKFFVYSDVTSFNKEFMEMEYEFRSLHPNLRIFKIKKEYPESVVNELDLSFNIFFSDLKSAANRLRNAIEHLLNEIKSPKKFKTKKGKFIAFPNLHQRIENYKNKKNKKIGELLMANKIIGNEGSHIGHLTKSDLLDAYEIIEEALKILYDKKSKRIKNMAKQIASQNKVRSKIKK